MAITDSFNLPWVYLEKIFTPELHQPYIPPKYAKEQIMTVFDLLDVGMTQKEISTMTGVNHNYISNIKKKGRDHFIAQYESEEQ
jgi:hypothetical protein